MKKIWTLAVVAALGISAIGCETATPPAKPVDVKVTPPAEGEMKEEAKPEEKKEEPKPEEKKEEPITPPADAPK